MHRMHPFVYVCIPLTLTRHLHALQTPGLLGFPAGRSLQGPLSCSVNKYRHDGGRG